MFTLKTKITEPIAIEGGLTPQMEMAIHEKYVALNMIDQSNEAINQKALAVLPAGGFLLAIISLVGFPNLSSPDASAWIAVAVAIGVIVFAIMIFLAILAYQPSSHLIPGPLEWDKMFSGYLNASVESCYDQVLKNLITSIEQHQVRNTAKARYLRHSLSLLIVQVGALATIPFLHFLS